MGSEELDLDRGYSVQEGINKVRNMQQETAEQKQEKKEEAEKLRMDLMLGNAKLERILVDTLVQNQKLTAEQLTKLADESDLVQEPDLVQTFIRGLTSRKKTIESTIKRLDEVSEDEASMKTSIFRNIKNDINAEIKPSEINIRTDYPLALIIELDEKKYEEIKNTKHLGGHFTHNQPISINDRGKNTTRERWLPVVVIRGFNKEQTESHEKRHAEDNLIVMTLSTVDFENSEGKYKEKRLAVWGEDDERYLSKSIKNLKTLYKEPDREKECTELIQSCVNTALGRAKHEILAEMESKEGEVEEYVTLLEDREGSYNYFREFTDGDNEIEEILWKKYTLKLRETTDSARKLFNMYKQNELFSKRKELFPSVLAQIPITKWEEQLNHPVQKERGDKVEDFMSEATLDKSIRSRILTSTNNLIPLGTNIEMTEEDKALTQRLGTLIEKRSKYIEENSDKQLITFLKELDTELHELEEEIQNSTIKNCNDTRKEYEDLRFKTLEIAYGNSIMDSSIEMDNPELANEIEAVDIDMWMELQNAKPEEHLQILKRYKQILSDIYSTRKQKPNE